MRIAVVGGRGIPDVHGGVERHCEELYPRIAAQGYDVTVYARPGYADGTDSYRGVSVKVVSAPRGRGLEAFGHTLNAMRDAAREGCDILHVHSIGPSAAIPFAHALGLKHVVATVHAPDYEQRKWGALARMYLRTGERFAVTKSSAVICVSKWYAERLAERYGRTPIVIPNGPGLVGLAPRANSPYLDSLGVERQRYLLFVGRLVPDKRVEDLLAAARVLGDEPLVVVAGDTSDSDAYAHSLRSAAGKKVLLPGYVYGQDLADLYAGADVFVLPSGVEGLPISALEAMSFGAPVVMSSIPANVELAGDGASALTYPVGDVSALARAIEDARTRRDELRARALARLHEQYDWDVIAARTCGVYDAIST